MTPDPTGIPPFLMSRLKQENEAHEKTVDTIARILWEGGEMLGDWDGGPAPTWDDVLEGYADKSHPSHEALSCYWLDTTIKASALLGLEAKQSMTLAMILLDQAKAKYERLELSLWHKIERAKGFEHGSLTGAPGVTQRIAL